MPSSKISSGSSGGPAGGASGRRGVHDLRLVIPALATWLTSMVLIGCRPAVAYLVAGLCAGAAAVGLTAGFRRGRAAPPGAAPASAEIHGNRAQVWWPAIARHGVMAGAVLACASAAAAGVGLRLSAIESGPVHDLAVTNGRAALEAVVTGGPQAHASNGREIIMMRVRVELLRRHGRAIGTRVPVLVLATERRWKSLVVSQRVRFMARLTTPKRAELLAGVAIVRGPPVGLGRPSVVQRAAEVIRARLRAACEGLPAAQRGVLPGMVVGDTSRLDPRLAADFKAAGLSHLLVVSGANLAIVAGAVLGLARIAGLGRRRAAALAAAAVLGFMVVARPEPSVLRATVMAMIGLLALVSGRERRGVPALCGAVVLLVLGDPELARSYGFALSVVATAALLVLAGPWQDRLSRRLPRLVAEPLAVAAAAQVACAPLLVMLSGELSLVAVGANLLAAPAVVPATLLGAAAGAVAPFAMPLARLLAWPAGLAVGWIVGVARRAAAVPYATVGWPDGLLGATVLLAAGALAYLVLRRRAPRRVAAAVLAGLVIVMIGGRAWHPGWPPRGWLFVACDVGQGDGLVLAAGPERAVVVDAGPDPARIDDCLTDLGVRAVPLLVLTHPHADHIDGVPGVLDGRAVGTVLTSGRTATHELPFLRAGQMRPAEPGQRWTVGGLSLTVLAPALHGPRVSTEDDGSTVNNVSVVMVARWAARAGGAGSSEKHSLGALLSGDVEEEAQRALVASVPPVDILKVPHHGSKKQDPAFLAATQARIAVISAGAGNDYGHPAPATLGLLSAFGHRTFRTDLAGSIAVVRTRSGIAVVPQNDAPS